MLTSHGICVDTGRDDVEQVRAVEALSAIFTVLAKKDKERNPLHYWLEDYEVGVCNSQCMWDSVCLCFCDLYNVNLNIPSYWRYSTILSLFFYSMHAVEFNYHRHLYRVETTRETMCVAQNSLYTPFPLHYRRAVINGHVSLLHEAV